MKYIKVPHFSIIIIYNSYNNRGGNIKTSSRISYKNMIRNELYFTFHYLRKWVKQNTVLLDANNALRPVCQVCVTSDSKYCIFAISKPTCFTRLLHRLLSLYKTLYSRISQAVAIVVGRMMLPRVSICPCSFTLMRRCTPTLHRETSQQLNCLICW